jgi:hypothetical protein
MSSALGALLAALLGALPPPPETAVLTTKMFGEVVVDHRAHLERRAPCKACHGSGPVGPIGSMGAERGHAACRGCHVEQARGPVGCRDCHIVKPRPEEQRPEEQRAAVSAGASMTAQPEGGGNSSEADPTGAMASTEQAGKPSARVAVESAPPAPAAKAARAQVRWPFAIGLSTSTVNGTEFDGRNHLTPSLEAAVMARVSQPWLGRLADGIAVGTVLGDSVSAGGSFLSYGCRGVYTARAYDGFVLDVAADLRVQHLRAQTDAAGRSVTTDTTAVLPLAIGRVGVTWREWSGGWLNLSFVAHSSLWRVHQDYEYRCDGAYCADRYRFGGFGYGISVGVASPLRDP